MVVWGERGRLGAVQVAGGALLGAVLDRAFDGTVRPMMFGILIYGLASLGHSVRWQNPGVAGVPAPVEVAP